MCQYFLIFFIFVILINRLQYNFDKLPLILAVLLVFLYEYVFFYLPVMHNMEVVMANAFLTMRMMIKGSITMTTTKEFIAGKQTENRIRMEEVKVLFT